MRHFLLILTVLIATVPVNAQTDSTEVIFANPELPPQFPGGMDSLLTFIELNNSWQVGRETITGKVFVEFVIEKDGSVTNIKVVKGLHKSCDEEAIRLISILPKFKPGEQSGIPVRMKMVMPITFDGMN